MSIKEKFNEIEKKWTDWYEDLYEDHPLGWACVSALEGAMIGAVISVPVVIWGTKYMDEQMVKALDYCDDRGFTTGNPIIDGQTGKAVGRISNKDYVKFVKKAYRKKW